MNGKVGFSLSWSLKELVKRFGIRELREYLGPEVLELVAIFDSNLVESNA